MNFCFVHSTQEHGLTTTERSGNLRIGIYANQVQIESAVAFLSFQQVATLRHLTGWNHWNDILLTFVCGTCISFVNDKNSFDVCDFIRFDSFFSKPLCIKAIYHLCTLNTHGNGLLSSNDGSPNLAICKKLCSIHKILFISNVCYNNTRLKYTIKYYHEPYYLLFES